MTTAEATTTEALQRDWVAGLLTPPDGVTQEAADEFAYDMTTVLRAAGWPTMDRQASIDLLQHSLEIGALTCRLVPLGEELEAGAGGTLAQTVASNRDDMVASFTASGVDQARAEDMVDGWLAGIYMASGDDVCPDHAAALDQAAGTL